MNRKRAIGLVLAAALSTAGSLRAAPPSIPGKSFNLVWNDEFDGSTLDASKWRPSDPNNRTYRSGFLSPSHVSLDGQGHLVLTASWDPALWTQFSATPYLTTGFVVTDQTFQHTFGYYEARIKAPAQVGHWITFWIDSSQMGNCPSCNDPSNYGAEVDIAEFNHQGGGFTSIDEGLHWNGYAAPYAQDSVNFTALGFDPTAQFHVYGLLWTPSSYTMFVDGQQVWQTSTAVSQVPQYILISDEPWTDAWAGGPAPSSMSPDLTYVDYVRVYDEVDGSTPPPPANTVAPAAPGGLSVL